MIKRERPWMLALRGRESRACARLACVRVCVSLHVGVLLHDTMTNRGLLRSNRSSMSCTVRWAPPSSFVRSAPRTTKTSRSSPAVTSCALPVSRPGRYGDEAPPRMLNDTRRFCQAVPNAFKELPTRGPISFSAANSPCVCF